MDQNFIVERVGIDLVFRTFMMVVSGENAF